jgi:hypothetical protein
MPRGVAPKTLALIAAAAAILAEVQPATVRGVCYQLFNRRLIPDMSKGATDRVSRALVRAREEGTIPWAWIVDETRPLELQPTWDDPDAYMEVVAESYRRDRWGSQPERVMIVSEKGTVGGVIRPVIRAYGLPFAVYHGFGSATALRNLAERSVADRRPLTILYVGDHDPSGRYMSEVDLPERLERYGGVARIERLAVTRDQIADHRLLTFSAAEKQKDARHAWFVGAYGQTCCELDAMDPNDLRQTVEDAIVRLIDPDAWELAGATEEAEAASLKAYFDAWPGAA